MIAEPGSSPGRGAWRHAALTCVAILAAVGVAGSALAAVPVKDLYRVAVPVTDQGRREQARATSEALETVLVRASGVTNVADAAAVREALSRPARYYLSLGYEAVQPGVVVDRPVANLPVSARNMAYLLEVRFDPQAVRELLVSAELPVWTGTRPEVLVWTALAASSGAREILGAASDRELVTAMRTRAHRRGLPLVLPLLDLADQAYASVAEVWARFENVVDDSMERYGTDGAVVGRVEPAPDDGWRGDWRGTVNGLDVDLEARGESPAAVARALVDQLSDQLASRYSMRLGTGERAVLWVQVDAVDTIASYADLMRYFESLLGVGDFQLVRVEGRSLLVRVETAGDPERVLDLIRLEERLALGERPAATGEASVWRARWRG